MKKKVKFKKIIVLIIGVLIEFLVHWWICNRGFLIKNYGISLSINWINSLFLNIIFILIIGLLYGKEKSFFLIFILIGGLVNMGDRLAFGYVRDYWTLGGTVVNNLNDWFIGVGVLLFLLETIWKK